MTPKEFMIDIARQFHARFGKDHLQHFFIAMPGLEGTEMLSCCQSAEASVEAALEDRERIGREILTPEVEGN